MPQKKGCTPWWIEKGLPHPMANPEARRKVAEFHRGKIPWNKGIAWPEAIKEKISKANAGKIRSNDFRLLRSEVMRGDRNVAKRPEVGMRISLSLKGRPRPSIRGHNHWAWTGGDGHIDPDFLLIRLDILKRDGHCQSCGATEKLLVHHRDRNKFNSIPENLIVLCRGCHRRLHNVVSAKKHLKLLEEVAGGTYW